MNAAIKQYGLETFLCAFLVGQRHVRLDELVAATDLSVSLLVKPMQRLVKLGVANQTPAGWEVNVLDGEPVVYKPELQRILT